MLVYCERVADGNNLGARYKGLKKLRGRNMKVAKMTQMTKKSFKEHFVRVWAERFKIPPKILIVQ